MRDLFRNGNEIVHPNLKVDEQLVKFSYRPTSKESAHGYFLIGPSRAQPGDKTIVTVFTPSMYAAGQLLH
jgi:hypothetical protein